MPHVVWPSKFVARTSVFEVRGESEVQRKNRRPRNGAGLLLVGCVNWRYSEWYQGTTSVMPQKSCLDWALAPASG